MSETKLKASRLILKLYLPVMLSVLATSLIGVLFGYLAHEARREHNDGVAGLEVRRELASFLLSKLAENRHDPQELRRLADQLDREMHINLSAYGIDGTPWATLGPWSLGPLEPDELDSLSRDGGDRSLDNQERIVVSTSQDGDVTAYGLVSLPPHGSAEWSAPRRRVGWGLLPGLGRPPYFMPPPALWTMVVLLVVLAIVAAIFVRDLAKPLLHLSGVARALGRGDLSVRARLDRKDELGELGHAFDEMANRVASLLQAQTELMASASHELRTPLARARVALDIASEGDAELAREQLGEIAQDLGELERLVADILIMARLDLKRGRLDGPRQLLRLEMVSSQAVIDETIERFHTTHRDRRLELELEIPSELPLLRADRVLLRRAVANILDNAVKYSEPERPVTLRARATDTNLELEVVDEGVGLYVEDLERIFTPFFRTDRSRTRATGGVGLGLALARRIVEAHDGSITVESAPNQGSTFRISIPFSISEATS